MCRCLWKTVKLVSGAWSWRPPQEPAVWAEDVEWTACTPGPLMGTAVVFVGAAGLCATPSTEPWAQGCCEEPPDPVSSPRPPCDPP